MQPSKYHLVILFALTALLQMTAPPDLLKGDQRKQVGYVMDLLHGGSLTIQYEVNGEIATKPPLYNWCAAAAGPLPPGIRVREEGRLVLKTQSAEVRVYRVDAGE